MELNNLRKISCLKKSEVYIQNNQKTTVAIVIEKLVEHGIHYLHASTQMMS